MKKMILIIMSVLIIFIMAFSLMACDKDNSSANIEETEETTDDGSIIIYNDGETFIIYPEGEE